MVMDGDEVRSARLRLLDASAHDRLDTMRHSAAHVMAAAVLDLFPEAKLGIGPAIRDGFYYDFDLPRALTPADLEAIEAKMREQVAADLPFERSEIGRDEAVAPGAGHAGQEYKAEIIRELSDEQAKVISFYRHGSFSDLCRGPHVEATGRIGPFKLLSSPGPTGAATRSARCSSGSTAPSGRRRTSSISTCGGVEEAKKRDHRKLGRDLTCSASTPSRRPRRSGIRKAWPCGAPWRPGRARFGARVGSWRSGLRRSCARSCGRPPATGITTRTTCSSWTTRTTSPA